MANAPFRPTDNQRRQVEQMAGHGITQEDMAAVLGISPGTLTNHFREDIDKGRAKAKATMAKSIFLRAQKSDTLAVFWAKVHLGWRDKDQSLNDGPVSVIKIVGGLPKDDNEAGK